MLDHRDHEASIVFRDLEGVSRKQAMQRPHWLEAAAQCSGRGFSQPLGPLQRTLNRNAGLCFEQLQRGLERLGWNVEGQLGGQAGPMDRCECDKC